MPADERMVDTRIPVLLEIGQLVLANVHHFWRSAGLASLFNRNKKKGESQGAKLQVKQEIRCGLRNRWKAGGELETRNGVKRDYIGVKDRGEYVL